MARVAILPVDKLEAEVLKNPAVASRHSQEN